MVEHTHTESPEYRAVKTSMDAWEMWEVLSEPQRLALILDRFPAADWYAHDAKTGNDNLTTLAQYQADPIQWGAIKQRFKEIGGNPFDLEKAVQASLGSHGVTEGHSTQFAHPESATHLLQKEFAPLRYFVDEILTEGLTILGGKPKKGKSYFCLDMSLAIAVGRQAFQRFATERARVLYVSLEDGPRRLQTRLKKIQPNLATPEGLDFLYEFPRLGTGALEALQHYAATYQVIVLDVLGRMLPQMQTIRKNLSEYQEFTELLGPIQRFAQEAHIAILLIDHVRKAAAEDIFDTIIGSQGKWGTADNGLVYERKGEEKDAVLHIAGRDVEEQKFVLSLIEGHIAFLGKGEVYELDAEQNRVITLLGEERRPLGAMEIMKSLGIHPDHYPRFRQVMQRMYNDDRVGRTKRGQFTLYGHDRTYEEYVEPIPFHQN